MVIPRKNQLNPESQRSQIAPLTLSSSHIILSKEVLDNWEEEVHNVFFAYYPERKQLLIAPISQEFFPKLHDSGQMLLKAKNLQGDKSIAIHELLIDHEIDPTNRNLEFDFLNKHGILKIYI